MKTLIHRSIAPKGGIISAFILFIGVVAFLVSNYASATDGSPMEGRLITIYDRGVESVILTESATIGEALKEAGVTIDENDAVEPALSEKLIASDYQVNIYRARPVIVVDGATKQKVVTPYQTGVRIAKDAGITLYNEDKTVLTRTDDIVSEGAGLRLTITRATPFSFILYGATTEARTQAKTVGDMLEEKGVKLTKDDRVSVPVSTEITAGLVVRVWREGKQTVTVEEEVAFDVEKIQDGDREIGYREVKTPGVLGSKNVTYEVLIQDGVEVGRAEISSLTTKDAQKQVEIVGAKNAYSSSLNEWLLALRTCETGNVYTKNTGNGFYGAYQFMISTWDAVAPKVGRPDLKGVRPDLASPADQDFMVVANANLSRGGLATQHPGCYAKLGLSQFPPS